MVRREDIRRTAPQRLATATAHLAPLAGVLAIVTVSLSPLPPLPVAGLRVAGPFERELIGEGLPRGPTAVVRVSPHSLQLSHGCAEPPPVPLAEEDCAAGLQQLVRQLDGLSDGAERPKRVVLQVEDEVPYQLLVAVVDAFAGLGLETVVVGTD